MLEFSDVIHYYHYAGNNVCIMLKAQAVVCCVYILYNSIIISTVTCITIATPLRSMNFELS